MERRTEVTAPGLAEMLDGLSGFFESLRKSGFGIEPAQMLMAKGLILNMAAKGHLPGSLGELGTLIGPIVCSSRRQQDDFVREFQSWVSRFEPGEHQGALAPADPVRNINEVGVKGRHAWRRIIERITWKFLAPGVALLIAAGLLAERLWPGRFRPPLPPGPTPGGSGKALMGRILEGASWALTTLPWLIGAVAVAVFFLTPGAWLVRRWSRTWWSARRR